METLQLREEFYWTGIVDDQLRVFDIIMYTEFGTTYNSYILKAGDKTVLFETAKAKFFDEYLEKLSEITADTAEYTASGSVLVSPAIFPAIMAVAPNSPNPLANARIPPDKIPDIAFGNHTFQKMHHSDIPSVLPA